VADGGVVERLAVAYIDLHGLLGAHVVDEEIDHGIRLAGFRIRLDVERVLDLRLVHLQVIVRHLLLVESVIGDSRAVGRPPHRGALCQLFAVHPARGPVLDAVLFAAVGGERNGVAAVGRTQPHVAILVERFQRLVG